MNKKRAFIACLFVSDNKWPWYYTIAWLIATTWYGWLFSPVVAFHTIGVPELAELRVLKGELGIGGPIKTYSRKRSPPDYYIDTADGRVTVHCGLLPHPRGCYGISYACFPPTRGATVWYHPYFGILQLECIEQDGKRTWFPYEDTVDVDVRQEIGRDGKGAVILFPLLLLIYAYQVRRVYRSIIASERV